MPEIREIPTLEWRCCSHSFACGPRTLIAAVINLTPDSFSDGGRYAAPARAAERARALSEAGADWIDLGGESSRPGSDPVPLDEELRRVLPAIEAIREVCDLPLSIDTTKAEVARQAVRSGAVIINDISALRADPDMARVAADSGAGVILMHMLGTPRTMQKSPSYFDAPAEVEAFLAERVEVALRAGTERERLCLDPGIGFGKRLEDNLALIASGWRLRRLGMPILVGASRKSFIAAVDDSAVEERLEGSLAAAVAAILHGADIVRVHDVAETRKAAAVADALKPYQLGG